MTIPLVEKVARAIATEEIESGTLLFVGEQLNDSKEQLIEDYTPEYLKHAQAAISVVYDWQDISTAPRNGDEFLAFGSYIYEGDVEPTTYISIAEYSGNEKFPWRDDEGLHPYGFFSHWLPLPPGPKTEAFAISYPHDTNHTTPQK